MTVGLPLILSTTLAAAAPGCSWAHPGANPYRGDPAKALADFGLPDETRRQLRAMLHAHRPTDTVTITRDDIQGDHGYGDLREMHNGGGQVCHGSVDRSTWSAGHRERALVYCADTACVIVPTVCHNIALVTRRPDVAAAPDDSPIDIEPAAGPPPASTPTQAPFDAAPPFDAMPPPDLTGPAPGAPESPVGGDDFDHAGGDVPIAGAPIGGGPVINGPPCCDLGPGGPGSLPIVPPVAPPIVPPIASVPEAPAWAAMLAALALAWWRRARRTPSFRPIGTVTSIK